MKNIAQIHALLQQENWRLARATAPDLSHGRGCLLRGRSVNAPGSGLPVPRRTHLPKRVIRPAAGYFPPVEAMPSMNCFWKMRYRMTMGSMASREPAISTGKLVVN